MIELNGRVRRARLDAHPQCIANAAGITDAPVALVSVVKDLAVYSPAIGWTARLTSAACPPLPNGKRRASAFLGRRILDDSLDIFAVWFLIQRLELRFLVGRVVVRVAIGIAAAVFHFLEVADGFSFNGAGARSCRG